MFGRRKRTVVDPAPATEAREETRVALNRVRANRPFVEALRDELVDARQQNNFAARVRAAYGEGR